VITRILRILSYGLGNFGTGLKEKAVKYGNGFLENRCRKFQTTKSKKLSN